MSDREALGVDSPAEDGQLNEGQMTALRLLEEICTASGLDCRPEVCKVQKPYLHIDLVGEDVKSTWGRSGPGLDALQFLVNLLVSRQSGSDVRVVLDADSYRERRAATLTKMAQDLAEEVEARNEEAELDPLPAHERRIIHNALLENTRVMTYSEGEEPDRRIIIAPRR